ncbi:MAG: AAA family ATPase [Atopobiaceae bacterium]|nr:AAA family ATPase [Atopobiaceae bacterium]
MSEDFVRFYNMSRNPFSKGLPCDLAHPTEDLRQVHARLDHLARAGGIGLITADPGMGKTFAVRTWADSLNPNTNRVVYLCLSTVTNMEFYRELCQGLGIEPCFKKTDMFRDVQTCVRSLVEERRQRVTVVVDEAHYLQSSVLRDLQMIANFDMDSRDMLALVLVGHSVLAQYLSRQPHEALRQRLVASYRMRGLDEAGTADYVRSMLLKAGADPDILDEAALASAHACAGGSVRRLNSVVTNALTIGAQQRARAIDAEMVRCAADELAIL